MSTLSGQDDLPPWAEELRRRYLRGEASQFVLHGNVHDLILHDGKLCPLAGVPHRRCCSRRRTPSSVYNVSTGVRFAKARWRHRRPRGLWSCKKEPARCCRSSSARSPPRTGWRVIIEYAETVAPAGDTSFSTVDDRAAAVTLHRWSMLRALEDADSIVLLTLENLTRAAPEAGLEPARGDGARAHADKARARGGCIRLLDAELPTTPTSSASPRSPPASS